VNIIDDAFYNKRVRRERDDLVSCFLGVTSSRKLGSRSEEWRTGFMEEGKEGHVSKSSIISPVMRPSGHMRGCGIG